MYCFGERDGRYGYVEAYVTVISNEVMGEAGTTECGVKWDRKGRARYAIDMGPYLVLDVIYYTIIL